MRGNFKLRTLTLSMRGNWARIMRSATDVSVNERLSSGLSKIKKKKLYIYIWITEAEWRCSKIKAELNCITTRRRTKGEGEYTNLVIKFDDEVGWFEFRLVVGLAGVFCLWMKLLLMSCPCPLGLCLERSFFLFRLKISAFIVYHWGWKKPTFLFLFF